MVNDARDEPCIGVQRGLLEECLEACFLLHQRLQFCIVEARQPVDDTVQFFLGAALFLHFGDIVRIDRGEAHFCEFLVVVGGVGHCRDFGVKVGVWMRFFIAKFLKQGG